MNRFYFGFLTSTEPKRVPKVNYWLMLANYPTFVPLLFLIKRNKLVFSAAFNFHRLASQLLFPLRVFDINFGWNHCQIRCPCNCNKQG